MTWDDFNQSLSTGAPPAGISAALAALWWDAKGGWQQAHELAQSDAGKDGSWVHAYLHRVEGDETNAAYWYRRAAQPIASGSLEAEREAIVRALLQRG